MGQSLKGKKMAILGADGFEQEFTQPKKALEEAEAADCDALLLPGGVANPDQLRMNEKAVEFVSGLADEGKPSAAICHGPGTLIEARPPSVRARRRPGQPADAGRLLVAQAASAASPFPGLPASSR